ncbi:hypothetical protein B0T17DRAFT_531015 [Bombardia bombarda]|uniref:Uncharacterized protein n=1 Tax=Bombardia bombarda TaxID=252184 RepID=A0AA39X029_9PEZI|nr:hypothetical protein B0T17DRAFT_531015 [Bombardia bombarda]
MQRSKWKSRDPFMFAGWEMEHLRKTLGDKKASPVTGWKKDSDGFWSFLNGTSQGMEDFL